MSAWDEAWEYVTLSTFFPSVEDKVSLSVCRMWSGREGKRQGRGSVAGTPCISHLSTIEFCLLLAC